MKIAQVIRRFHFQEWGGTENVVWNTTKALIARGNDVEILATLARGGAEEEKIEGETIRRFPYFYPYFPMTERRKTALDKKGGNPMVPRMEHYLRKTPFDLIHCHNLGRLAELCARAAKKKNIPFLISLHGGCYDVPEEEKGELLRPLHRTLSYGGIVERLFGLRRDALKLASGIICVGENELEEIQKRFPEKKVLFLPNGVNPEKFQHPGAAEVNWRGMLGIGAKTKLLLNVSRIDYQKNQLLLIRMVETLLRQGEDVHLLMIGPVSADWYAREIMIAVKEHQLEKHVTLIPGLPPDDPKLFAAYREADCFLLPSIHEPFGIVALETWSAGVPLVASNVGGLGRLVHDGEDGELFESGSLSSLIDAYHRAERDRSKIVEGGRREVARKYDWKIVAAQLENFYAEILREYRK